MECSSSDLGHHGDPLNARARKDNEMRPESTEEIRLLGATIVGERCPLRERRMTFKGTTVAGGFQDNQCQVDMAILQLK